MPKLLLLVLSASGLFANAIFTAPTGCTALAPAPDVTGVQCFGSFTGPVITVASFSGGGSGSLFATSALFEWDFTTEGLFPRIVNAFANVNGQTETRLDIAFGFSQRHTGSVQIPVTFGETLSFWQFIVDSSEGSRIDIPATGVGLRLLVNHTPPSTAIPEPATAATFALGLGTFLLRRHRRSLPLLLLLAPGLFANAIFTAPTGCAAIAPAPDVTGVQCFGSFAGDTSLQANFAGGGSGPLWATSATLDYDFTSSSTIVRAITIITSINGGGANTLFLRTFGAAQETGSLTIPLTFGEALNSWLINVFVGTATPDASLTLDIPSTGVGLRLLVEHNPPSTAIPEPSTAGLAAIAALALLGVRAKRLAALPLLALAPLSAAPLFTAPAGCTVIQTAPNIEGVQCYGDTGLVRGATPELSFAGGGTGPLWASEVILEWDFVVAGGGGNIVPVLALVNGESGFTPTA